MPRGKSKEERAEIRRRAEARRDPGKDRTAHESGREARVGAAAFSDLSRSELSDEEFTQALLTMHEESDRALAIMGSALVENGLAELIEAHLVNRDNVNALFHDAGAPFGTLRNKAAAAYAMGLIDRKTADDIDHIREIRNQFSHALRPIDFKHPAVKLKTEKISSYAPVDLMKSIMYDPRLLRFRFEVACPAIWIILMRKANSILQDRHQALTAQLAITSSLFESRPDNIEGDVEPI